MIIFGLGNPGPKYRFTRHNAGYIFLDRLARSFRKRFSRKRNFRITTFKVKGTELTLIKPNCWMNQCGGRVNAVLGEEKPKFMVVVDDINLPLGKLRLRSKGSDGGHLGLRSIIDELKTENFPRLRIGIGQPQIDTADYVLSRFNTAEKRVLTKVMSQGIRGIRILVSEGFLKAQNYINAIHIEFDANR
jgi:PTH1 family peptidyl-tRNA hydrolase